MTYKFLIDECLSPQLVELAVHAGHVLSTCVRDRGWSGVQDWRLVEIAVASNFTLVTHNSVDFRGKGADEPGGLYANVEVHAGLVCLNSAHVMTIARQRRLFECALAELSKRPDLINMTFEVFEHEDETLEVALYDIPELHAGEKADPTPAPRRQT